MDELVRMLEKNIGQWVAIYVAGSFPNVVGGRVTNVTSQCVALDQETVIAFVPFERILYLTCPKQPEAAAPSA